MMMEEDKTKNIEECASLRKILLIFKFNEK